MLIGALLIDHTDDDQAGIFNEAYFVGGAMMGREIRAFIKDPYGGGAGREAGGGVVDYQAAFLIVQYHVCTHRK